MFIFTVKTETDKSAIRHYSYTYNLCSNLAQTVKLLTCYGGARFKSGLGHQLSRLRLFVVFFSLLRQVPEYLKLDLNRFLAIPFQFTVIQSGDAM
jgi:hypothetical protein